MAHKAGTLPEKKQGLSTADGALDADRVGEVCMDSVSTQLLV